MIICSVGTDIAAGQDVGASRLEETLAANYDASVAGMIGASGWVAGTMGLIGSGRGAT